MADVTVTAANVVPAAGYSAETNYLAGATITRGQAVYLSAANTWLLADADASALAAGSTAVGISLSDVVATQPMLVMQSGVLSFGAVLTKGKIYCVSATAGGIAPYADLTTAANVTILGIASATSNLTMRQWASSITIP